MSISGVSVQSQPSATSVLAQPLAKAAGGDRDHDGGGPDTTAESSGSKASSAPLPVDPNKGRNVNTSA